jgi:hypothetical protein
MRLPATLYSRTAAQAQATVKLLGNELEGWPTLLYIGGGMAHGVGCWHVVDGRAKFPGESSQRVAVVFLLRIGMTRVGIRPPRLIDLTSLGRLKRSQIPFACVGVDKTCVLQRRACEGPIKVRHTDIGACNAFS